MRGQRKAAFQLAVGVFLLGASCTGATAEAVDLAAIGKAGFETCMKAFPDPKKIHAAMEEDGWRYEQSDGRYRLYSKNGRRILVGTPTVAHGSFGCMVAVSKLTGDQAVALAQSIVGSIPSAKPAELTTSDSLAEWVATVNGVPVRLGAMKPGDFFVMRGAGIIMGDE